MNQVCFKRSQNNANGIYNQEKQGLFKYYCQVGRIVIGDTNAI